jgi:hypothetical protein
MDHPHAPKPRHAYAQQPILIFDGKHRHAGTFLKIDPITRISVKGTGFSPFINPANELGFTGCGKTPAATLF